MSIRITAAGRPPRSVVVRVPGPQGPAGTANLGTVTVVNPNQNPNVTATGTARDRIYNFVLPRAAAFIVGDVVTGDDATDIAVTDVGTNGDVELDFRIPRATVDVGTTSTVNPNVAPSVANSGTNAAAVFDFDLPRAAEFAVEPVNVVDPDQPPAVTMTADDGDYDLEFSLPRAPVITVDTPATVLNPDQQPAVGSTTTDGDVEIAFDLPRAPSVTVGTVTPVNPDVAPDVTNSGANGDVVLDIDLPRAPTFAVGTVGTVGPSDPATATDVGTDGDIVLDLDLPRGEKGWAPAFSVTPDGNRRVLEIVDWVGGEGTKPATGDYIGLTGFVSDIAEAVDIRGEQGPAGTGAMNDLSDVIIEDVENGDIVRYDANIENWINTSLTVFDLSDVDEGSGFNDGDVLIYNAISGNWEPGAAEAVFA